MRSIAFSAAYGVCDIVKTIPIAGCAEVNFTPNINVDEVSGLQIVVCPNQVQHTQEGATRKGLARVVSIDIAVVKHCNGNNDFLSMLDLTETIANTLSLKRIPNVGAITDIAFIPLYDTDRYNNLHVFLSVLNATIKVFQ